MEKEIIKVFIGILTIPQLKDYYKYGIRNPLMRTISRSQMGFSLLEIQ